MRLVAGQGAATVPVASSPGCSPRSATAGALESLLFGVEAHASASAMLATGDRGGRVGAVLLPARRALRVDPLRALREDGG